MYVYLHSSLVQNLKERMHKNRHKNGDTWFAFLCTLLSRTARPHTHFYIKYLCSARLACLQVVWPLGDFFLLSSPATQLLMKVEYIEYS